MSRIYDALQKAESDRKAEQQDATVAVQEHPAAKERFAAAITPQLDGEVRPELPPASVSAAPPAAYVPSAAATGRVQAPAAGLDAFDPSQVAARPWSLSSERLPALLDRGPAVEQFRSLRSRLFELRDIKPLKSVLVTSGLPQEGKSFVAANLAMSLARHKNSKVLLIDGDMRRYTLHQLLGCQSHPGLADYLAGKATPAEIIQRPEIDEQAPGTIQSMLGNVMFVAGGNGGDKAADLSGSSRFGQFVRDASRYFDWIIVDSSPVLPVSDAVNLARSCDGVLLVARDGVTKFKVAQRAQAELKAANVLGFVLNAVQEAPHGDGYYGYDAAQQ